MYKSKLGFYSTETTYCTGTTAREANKDTGPEVNVTVTKHMGRVSTKHTKNSQRKDTLRGLNPSNMLTDSQNF
jgi:hypothetical protein